MNLQKAKRKCFAVLLIVVFVIREPSLSKADYFERDLYSWNRRACMYSFKEVSVNRQDPESKGEFRIRCYLNGGSFRKEIPKDDTEKLLMDEKFPSSGTICYTKDDLPFLLAAPEREGFNFAGWYTDSSYTHKVWQIDEDALEVSKLYAKWTKYIDGNQNVQMYSYQNTPAPDQTSKKLKDCRYDFLENIQIPGMPSTRETDVREKKIANAGQCPQGICITEDYLLISSYSSADESLGGIHIFDRQTGSHLAALGMKGNSHLGGLAFDGEAVWVCHSENNTLERIPYAFIRQIASIRPQAMVDCSALFREYHVLNEPSCIVYDDGKLWVATHTKFFNSKMISYQLTERGLRPTDTYRIPDKVQGIAFDKEGRVYISSSYGRKKSSYLKVYASADDLDKKPGKPIIKVEMPPCSEEIALTEEKIYVLFESAGEKYLEGTDGKGKSTAPIDQILTIGKKSVLQ